MSTNDRIFYATQAVGIQPHGDGANVVPADMVHGLQSVGMNTNFNLEQAFELGQIEIYENIEGTPDVEMTLEKVLDGYDIRLASQIPYIHWADIFVSTYEWDGRDRDDIRLGIFPDNFNNVGAGTASAEAEVYCSGMYVSSISYTLPVDGSATESVTLVGNNKVWLTNAASAVGTASGSRMIATAADPFDGTDSPAAKTAGTSDGAATHSGGIQQREDVIMSGSILPASIKGVVGANYANGLDVTTLNNRVHLQNVSVSTDFSREDILELGRKTPYTRPATFPIEVSCEIEAITTSGDFVNAYEFGDSALDTTADSGNNTSEENIFFCTRAGYGFDLGQKNRLASVSYGGGDAGGGNATCTYSYTNFNELDVQHYTENGYIGFEELKVLNGAAREFTFPANIYQATS